MFPQTSGKLFLMTVLVVVSVESQTSLDWSECVAKHFGHSSSVCVCNSTYCDGPVFPNGQLPPDFPVQVTSDARGRRFATRNLQWSRKPWRRTSRRSRSSITLRLDRRAKRQSILGFGNSFTDAAGINVHKLSGKTQEKLLKSYYGEEGIDLGLGRTNIGGCDFSPRPYSYVDKVGDVELATFALQPEDVDHKIPLIKAAQRLRGGEAVKLIGSPWSAPPWMKTNNDYSGLGFLKRKHRQHWANYLVRYFEEYGKRNVSFWGLTAQNEPEAGFVPFFPFNCMGFSPSSQRTFISEHLGPSLEAAGMGHLRVMAGDTQRPILGVFANKILSDPEASQYVDGMGVHWYWDDLISLPSVLDNLQERFPDKFLLYTESCTGYHYWDLEKVRLGDWGRGERYLESILENLNHWVVGWIDWNLALDLQGGPNWAENFVDSPIIVDPPKDLFYKQPMYYALGHASRFLPEGSMALRVRQTNHKHRELSFFGALRPDGGVTLVLLNKEERGIDVTLKDPTKGQLHFHVGAKSFQTIVY